MVMTDLSFAIVSDQVIKGSMMWILRAGGMPTIVVSGWQATVTYDHRDDIVAREPCAPRGRFQTYDVRSAGLGS